MRMGFQKAKLRMRPAPARSWLVGAMIAGALPAGGIELDFSAADYATISGGTVEVGVAIAYEAGETPGLFSYGVRLVTSGSGSTVATSVQVPAELDFTAFRPGATKDLSAGVNGVKGNTRFTGQEFAGYRGTWLATFTLRGIAPGVVDLGLEIFRTVGSSEDVFVSTDGTVLDDEITFGSATLTVAPAPALEITRLDVGRVRVRFATVAGLRYFLRRSEDLVDWELIAETAEGASGGGTFEFSTSASDRVFFRLDVLPDGA